ncbi:HD domain-containing protein [Clostridium boliviensis]|uniref:HD domain-containing protein n=1 Tax=Clostridium boliviensis TaxID=318465 RepID=A0ABU4GSH6_9CLOT|nr:HD domain-containing protein [Clostridium boliviensis]MDW2799950.1 HD domain-containing protein [Clostridium boliviensis]
MEAEDRISMIAVFIDEHIKEELTVLQLSARVGYSPGYFTRCFKRKFGISPMEYVKQRKLLAAAKEIAKGKRILDAAVDYGWETHSGFTKSFTSVFGYSPVLLRAIYVRDASVKGEKQQMEAYIKTAQVYKKPEELWQILCLTLKENKTEYNNKKLKEIYKLAKALHEGEKRKTGEDYITHPLNVAIILADMGSDENTVCAGLLHDVWLEKHKERISLEAGSVISGILLSYEKFKQTHESSDDRGVLVALSDRLHNMRTIEFVDPATWKRRAEETMRIFSPIASKCSDFRLRCELDERSVKFL